MMKNVVLDKIKQHIMNELNKAYGFCGVADGENRALLNSSDNTGHDIEITIKIKDSE
jgi:hypothetical protein